MLNDYGFASLDWNAAKDEARAVLIEVARHRDRISYSDLACHISAIEIGAHDPRLFHLLGEISREENKLGRGMLTAIVVHKSGDMQPGPGFFELAKSLGKDTSDKLVCWISEFNRVHDYWSRQEIEPEAGD